MSQTQLSQHNLLLREIRKAECCRRQVGGHIQTKPFPLPLQETENLFPQVPALLSLLLCTLSKLAFLLCPFSFNPLSIQQTMVILVSPKSDRVSLLSSKSFRSFHLDPNKRKIFSLSFPISLSLFYIHTQFLSFPHVLRHTSPSCPWLFLAAPSPQPSTLTIHSAKNVLSLLIYRDYHVIQFHKPMFMDPLASITFFKIQDC